MGCRRVVLAIALMSVLVGPLRAQIPLGSEFRVDTLGGAFAATGGRSARNSAASPGGDFVVAWSTFVPGGQLLDIRARRFAANGRARGLEFTVNAATTGYQGNAAVAIGDTGAFVVVWDTAVGLDSHVDGRRFDAAGVPLGADFRVSTGTAAQTPAVAVAPSGSFVVVWTAPDGSNRGIFGRRYAPDGSPVGGEFQVNTYTTGQQFWPSVETDGAGNFVVAWANHLDFGSRVLPAARMFAASGTPIGDQFTVSSATTGTHDRPRVARSRDGSFVVVWQGLPGGILGRRFDAGGAPVGADFRVDPGTTADVFEPEVDAGADGDFIVTWYASDADSVGVFGRRFERTGVPGAEFRANTYQTGDQFGGCVAADPAGNFVVTWHSHGQNGVDAGVFAQRYAGGLSPAAMDADATSGPSSDGNRVLEPGETVGIAPSWLNANPGAQAFTGTVTSFTGPGTTGDPAYTIADGAASYGTVATNATGSCTATGDCYALGISVPTARPAAHWDARFREDIAPANLGALKGWDLHVGDSFPDVPRSNPFYRFVETLLHHGVTGGCTSSTFCPADSTSREQMAVFVLVAKEGSGYAPPACNAPLFDDVPASSPFCRWIEELARRGVVAGCGGGSYCPTSAVAREQMAVFVLRTLDPALVPPACTAPLFSDVPASSPFCRWIEELARRGVVGGCGGGAYCPAAPVTREQMGVFLSATFGLQLYGP